MSETATDNGKAETLLMTMPFPGPHGSVIRVDTPLGLSPTRVDAIHKAVVALRGEVEGTTPVFRIPHDHGDAFWGYVGPCDTEVYVRVPKGLGPTAREEVRRFFYDMHHAELVRNGVLTPRTPPTVQPVDPGSSEAKFLKRLDDARKQLAHMRDCHERAANERDALRRELAESREEVEHLKRELERAQLDVHRAELEGRLAEAQRAADFGDVRARSLTAQIDELVAEAAPE